LEEMKALDREFSQTFAAKENKTFIVFHPAWSYLARDYGLVQVPIMEEEKEPGPQYLASLIDMAKKNDITTIFVDPQFNPKSAEVIAREMNATIVVLDPLAEDYLQNMRRTGEEISKSLK
jgi:zinc transport system substrate-binding protein